MLFVVRLERGGPWDWSRDLREQDGFDEHARLMDSLVDDGFILLGGPLEGARDVLHVIDAPSEEAVRERLAEDNWHQNGMLRITNVESWTVPPRRVGHADMKVIRTSELEPIVPPDGSEVREIARPPDTAHNQSLAQAVVPSGGETTEHFHRASEEIYHFVSGKGRMRLGDEETEVGPGETVVIPPGTRHKLWNSGGEPLVLLCCSSPPYYDEDTVLTE